MAGGVANEAALEREQHRGRLHGVVAARAQRWIEVDEVADVFRVLHGSPRHGEGERVAELVPARFHDDRHRSARVRAGALNRGRIDAMTLARDQPERASGLWTKVVLRTRGDLDVVARRGEEPEGAPAHRIVGAELRLILKKRLEGARKIAAEVQRHGQHAVAFTPLRIRLSEVLDRNPDRSRRTLRLIWRIGESARQRVDLDPVLDAPRRHEAVGNAAHGNLVLHFDGRSDVVRAPTSSRVQCAGVEARAIRKLDSNLDGPPGQEACLAGSNRAGCDRPRRLDGQKEQRVARGTRWIEGHDAAVLDLRVVLQPALLDGLTGNERAEGFEERCQRFGSKLQLAGASVPDATILHMHTLAGNEQNGESFAERNLNSG